MNKTILPSRILIPEGIDLTKWAVVACDQHTSEKTYWENLRDEVGNSPSTLKMILPEAFLQTDNSEEITTINAQMQQYLSSENFFKEYFGYILTVRKTKYGVTRVGIVLCINLDDYSFEENSKSIIRATEGTVKKRIPPRVQVRKNAKLETTHIMLLANDSKCFVIEKLYQNRLSYQKIYDFELNMDGGRIEGYFIPSDVNLDDQLLKTKSGEILFAVGDGNHSLATAKTIWEDVKLNLSNGERDERQFALCEVVNVLSDGITFEPIHRLVKGIDANSFIDGLKLIVGGKSFTKIVTNDVDREIFVPENPRECYEQVQSFIDTYIAINGGEVDYIHGIKTLRTLAENDNCIGIVMPSMDKTELFDEVEKNGLLPRKSFSMGEANDKRYYLECRKL